MKHLPLYEQIYKDILEEIERGVYVAGDKLPSEKEISEKYEVSRITSTKAFELLVEDKKVVRIAGKGTFVVSTENEATAELVENKAKAPVKEIISSRITIGVIFDSFGPSFGGELLRGIETECRASGYNMLFSCTNGNVDEETNAIDRMLEAGVQGIVIMCVHNENYNANVLKLVVDKFPIVTVDRHLKGIPISHVGTDNESAAKELTEHLLNKGYKNICVVKPDSNLISTLIERENGYAQALSSHDLVVDENLKFSGLKSVLPGNSPSVKIDEDFEVMRKFLKEHENVDSFFATGYDVACIIFHILHEMKLHKKYPIVCFDYSDDVTNDCLFTHIRQDENEIGKNSIRLLTNAINGDLTTKTVHVPYEVVYSNLND